MNQMYPCLWVNGNAREVADYYCGIFKDSELISENPFVVIFKLQGNRFMALNGGSEFSFSPATSFVVECADQEEIDYYWNALGNEGEFGKCGWLTDKFGVSWQIVPAMLGKLMGNPEKAPKAMYAFMQMTKFDIAALEIATS